MITKIKGRIFLRGLPRPLHFETEDSPEEPNYVPWIEWLRSPVIHVKGHWPNCSNVGTQYIIPTREISYVEIIENGDQNSSLENGQPTPEETIPGIEVADAG